MCFYYMPWYFNLQYSFKSCAVWFFNGYSSWIFYPSCVKTASKAAKLAEYFVSQSFLENSSE